jgi:hypothetical protein
MPTYRSQRTDVTLLLNPGPEQRALRVLDSARADLADRAVRLARARYGDDAVLGWLDHRTKVVEAV